MDDHGSPALRRLIEALPDAVLETHAHVGDGDGHVRSTRERVVEVLRACCATIPSSSSTC